MLRVEPAQKDTSNIASKLSTVKTVQFTNSIHTEQKQQIKPEQKTVSTASLSVKSPEEVAKQTGLSIDFVKRIMKEETLRLDEYVIGEKPKDKPEEAHKDKPKGPTLIGYGHNIDSDSNYPFERGKSITKEQALYLLAKDLKKAKTDSEGMTAGVNLTLGQKEALIDMIFNGGPEKLRRSDLIKMIKAGKIDEAVKEFDMIRLNGEVNPTLCNRRIQNIYDYSKHNPTQAAAGIMTLLLGKAKAVYDEKIANAKSPQKKANLEAQKKQTFEKSDKLTKEIKDKVPVKKPVPPAKKPQKGFWETIKDLMFYSLSHPMIDPVGTHF